MDEHNPIRGTNAYIRSVLRCLFGLHILRRRRHGCCLLFADTRGLYDFDDGNGVHVYNQFYEYDYKHQLHYHVCEFGSYLDGGSVDYGHRNHYDHEDRYQPVSEQLYDDVYAVILR